MPPPRGGGRAGGDADVVLPVELAGELAEPEGEVRPQRGVVPVLVEVPAGAAAGQPHGALRLLRDQRRGRPPGPAGVVSSSREALGVHGLQRVVDVGDLRLDHVDHRRVADADVRARPAGTGSGSRRRWRCWLLTMPSDQTSARRAAVAAADLLGDRQVGHVEAGGQHDRVGRALDAVPVDDRVRADLGDARGDQLGVGGGDGGEVVVADQDALAADRVVRRQRRAQLRVADLLAQVRPGQLLRPASGSAGAWPCR